MLPHSFANVGLDRLQPAWLGLDGRVGRADGWTLNAERDCNIYEWLFCLFFYIYLPPHHYFLESRSMPLLLALRCSSHRATSACLRRLRQPTESIQLDASPLCLAHAKLHKMLSQAECVPAV